MVLIVSRLSNDKDTFMMTAACRRRWADCTMRSITTPKPYLRNPFELLRLALQLLGQPFGSKGQTAALRSGRKGDRSRLCARSQYRIAGTCLFGSHTPRSADARRGYNGQHGSWNRKPPSGYKVIFVPFAGGRPSGAPIDVLTGFLSPTGEALGRPVGVTADVRGGLLVADDVGNTIWRLTQATPQEPISGQ